MCVCHLRFCAATMSTEDESEDVLTKIARLRQESTPDASSHVATSELSLYDTDPFGDDPFADEPDQQQENTIEETQPKSSVITQEDTADTDNVPAPELTTTLNNASTDVNTEASAIIVSEWEQETLNEVEDESQMSLALEMETQDATMDTRDESQMSLALELESQEVPIETQDNAEDATTATNEDVLTKISRLREESTPDVTERAAAPELDVETLDPFDEQPQSEAALELQSTKPTDIAAPGTDLEAGLKDDANLDEPQEEQPRYCKGCREELGPEERQQCSQCHAPLHSYYRCAKLHHNPNTGVYLCLECFEETSTSERDAESGDATQSQEVSAPDDTGHEEEHNNATAAVEDEDGPASGSLSMVDEDAEEDSADDEENEEMLLLRRIQAEAAEESSEAEMEPVFPEEPERPPSPELKVGILCYV